MELDDITEFLLMTGRLNLYIGLNLLLLLLSYVRKPL